MVFAAASLTATPTSPATSSFTSVSFFPAARYNLPTRSFFCSLMLYTSASDTSVPVITLMYESRPENWSFAVLTIKPENAGSGSIFMVHSSSPFTARSKQPVGDGKISVIKRKSAVKPSPVCAAPAKIGTILLFFIASVSPFAISSLLSSPSSINFTNKSSSPSAAAPASTSRISSYRFFSESGIGISFSLPFESV